MFTKLPNHLVTYNRGNNQSQIDFKKHTHEREREWLWIVKLFKEKKLQASKEH